MIITQTLRSATIFILLASNTLAQNNPTWHVTSAPVPGNRYDDIVFLNADLGWAVNFDGILIKTTDEGNNWQILNGPIGSKYRCVSFLDSLNGFIGKLEVSNTTAADTNFFFSTNDGGISWNAVSNFPGPRPAGICGMYRVNDSVLYAVGRYSGPACVYKTVDRGNSWQFIDMSDYASGLVDAYFWSPDSGIVVGAIGNVNPWDSGAVILSTFDGGNSWQERYKNSARPGIGWKISFPSGNTGYVSIQPFDFTGNNFFLKTIDGGLTWEEKIFSVDPYNAEGIGFISDSVGWIGGGFTHSFMTIDGGDTWIKDTIGIVPGAYQTEGALNRFRFISDTLGYGSGMAVYRYSIQGILIGIADYAINPYQLEIYPNPSNTNIIAKFILSKSCDVRISLQTFLGGTVFETNRIFMKEGEQVENVNISHLDNGVYFMVLETGNSLTSHRLVISR